MVQNGHRAMPTREQLHTWRGYIETADVLRSRLGTRMQHESSLSTGDYQVLLALSEAEGRTLRASALALHIGWERSRLSHHLGRMEKRGLIGRATCADDVHGIEVSMTPEGADSFRAGSVPHLRAVKELFLDALSADQLAQVEDLTRTLRTHLDLEPQG
ncbi:MarR family winged helix-turn-helix transcriptional regulator [Brachybacterium sp. FME24]|uniref:MarR family winged helix-turn-helix transcriptional regulator n=1 Tax=Brachybacterium sp. FME24 TaxID=2742605 RepID=UPI0018663792|nr:MarR family winged helix-turn-helix transcriptional regulator [Brachybacterium sp. FME24]